jgi:FtsP/CotA-like multicopper oxidase with cupredoxin domain
MKRTFTLIALLLMFSVFAAAQANKVPTCNGFNASGAPIDTTSGSTVCTDFFGVGNWANSPLPAGTITGYTLISPGSGYTNPQVVIADITGAGATAIASFDSTGAITGITGSATPNYTMPQVSIVDVGVGGLIGAPMCGGAGQLACGSGAMATAVIGPPFTAGTGMLKFQDALPDLKSAIAVADQTTFPGSDFYVIGLVQYQAQFHTNLPPTTLRGYCQLANAASTTCATQSYLGPVILAQKNRPVRVLFKNMLPTGAGGNLFIPMDDTYMGANDLQNRATLHLHGGATPWISDGTPHQWTSPIGEVAEKGVSTESVPDMYFDGSGNVVPFCSATVTSNCYPNGTFTGSLPAGATNQAPAGEMTFYWTNQQGGRLMFYHDHAYGITRLNVYVGEAAGYLLYDPAEEAALANAGAPGTIAASPDLAHLVPLVIQDKTFVAPAQIPVQDPTWSVFGTTPGTPNLGDLWFPHVYIPNQDPNDPMGGANGFGRWDYGAWFFPPQTSLTAGLGGAVTIPCTSAAFPGQTLQPVAPNNNQGCPIIPNPSGTPEGFMDTPIINGKAYPVLHVAAESYRFQILSAGNDRSWNLSWFLADPAQNNTEVAMLPAVPPYPGSPLPLCGPINPVAVPMLDIGLATGLMDSTGNPLNGTGLASACWPNYGPQPGIPAPQAMWAADGRAGGSPDPRNAGPAWVQIGTEGGLLPTPVVIPPTAINYEQNTRSITITSVAVHGLWLGPAERADVLVDFSKFAGRTLILYNDAPTPAPAFDSRLDYFTGDGDQTPIGGAPNTQPGYGPNTRTVMQVVVDLPSAGGHALSVPALKAAFASTAAGPGLFASTQPTTIVPEPNYNSAYNASFPPKYSGIGDNSMTFTPIAPLNFESLLGAEPSACTTTPTPPVQCGTFNHKAIQELFTTDYGRMNATLGTELPNVNFQNQTTIPLGYVDPATEIVRQGDTQLWKITHNGVDSHFIHFHLFNVQVINRVGWDGSLRPPDANEMGWKDTVRMNPLEDVLVALQPITPQLPWPIHNSVRRNDVTGMGNMFTNLDPFSNNGATTVDGATNFGWEYVWHCHILGHEENDMMRPIMFQVPPPAPGNLLAATDTVNGGVKLTWTDNSASETGFTVQRDIDPAFPNPVTISVGPSATVNAVGEGTDWGSTISANDSSSLVSGTTYYYRVQAVDDGFKSPFEQSYNNTAALLSAWSNLATIQPVPIAGISPVSLVFGNVTVGTITQTLASGQLAQVTISNTGNAILTLISGQTGSADFTSTASGCVNVNPGTTCTFTVTYAPTTVGAASATIAFTTNDPAHGTLVVSLTGTGVVTTAITINAPTVTYNANGVATLTVASTPAGFTPPGNVTLTVDGGTPSSQPLVSGSATFTIATPSAGSHTLFAAYATQSGFQGSTASSTLTVTPAPLTISPTPNPASMIYGGAIPSLTPSYSGFVGAEGSGNLTGTATCSTTATSTSVVGAYTSVCAGASSKNYTIAYPTGVVNVGKASTTTLITSNVPSRAIIGQIVTVSFSVSPQFTGTPSGTVTVRASTNETCSAALTAGSGRCTLTFATGGSRTLTATYSGDGNFLASSSGPATQLVSNLSLSTSSLLFGNQLVGTRSANQTVTLSNVGTTPISISGIAWSTNFSDSNNCGTTLNAGRSCRINVNFLPTTTGVLTGTLTITDSDVTSPQIVALTGTGVSPAASVTPIALSFSSTLNVTTAAQTVTVANSGTAPVTINSIGGLGSQFAQTNTCGAFPAVVAVGGNCTIGVTFTPTSAGTKNATMTIGFAAPVASQSVTLSGAVIVPTFTLAPGTLAFGNITRNTNSAPQAITVTNTSSVALTFTTIRTAGGSANQYTQNNNCGTSLAAGAFCTVNVTFAPTSRGLKNATLQVNVATPATSASVTLTGTGQ